MFIVSLRVSWLKVYQGLCRALDTKLFRFSSSYWRACWNQLLQHHFISQLSSLPAEFMWRRILRVFSGHPDMSLKMKLNLPFQGVIDFFPTDSLSLPGISAPEQKFAFIQHLHAQVTSSRDSQIEIQKQEQCFSAFCFRQAEVSDTRIRD